MRKILLLSVLSLGFLFSCIENDIPLPTIEGDILEFEAKGQIKSTIDLVNNKVEVEFYEGVDLTKVEISKFVLTKDARAFTGADQTGKIVAGSVVSLDKPLGVTVITYQSYQWTISAKLIPLLTVSVDPWATKIYFKSSISTGLGSFEYKKSDETTWSQTSGKVEGEFFRGVATGLIPNTDYQARVVFDGKAGDPVDFKTEGTPNVENMNFEQGYYNGKTFYPNANNATLIAENGGSGNYFWSTGNEGVTMALIGKESNTYPIKPGYNSETAICMTGIAVPIVKFAAGNFFIGNFKTNIANPKSSAKFGRPYVGRPSKLKGWYKYKSSTITQGENFEGGKWIGTPDRGVLWISIENWGIELARPGGVLGGIDRKGVLGYGRIIFDKDAEDFTAFTIDIEYRPEAIEDGTKPTHIVIASSSSIYGDDFCGGISSFLTLDEFSFEF